MRRYVITHMHPAGYDSSVQTVVTDDDIIPNDFGMKWNSEHNTVTFIPWSAILKVVTTKE